MKKEKTEPAPRDSNLIMIRMPPSMIDRLDKMVQSQKADPKMQGAEVSRNDVIRQGVDIGLDELERRWSTKSTKRESA